MAYKYENHGKIFKEEKDSADQYEKLYKELKEAYRLKYIPIIWTKGMIHAKIM